MRCIKAHVINFLLNISNLMLKNSSSNYYKYINIYIYTMLDIQKNVVLRICAIRETFDTLFAQVHCIAGKIYIAVEMHLYYILV